MLLSQLLRPKRIYLDHAAATPVRTSVLRAMESYIADEFGNPSAIHKEGTQARQAIDDARTKVARTLGVRPEGIVFTGNGSESNNLAIYGVVRSLVESGKDLSEIEIITTKLEHPSILEVVTELEAQGATIKYAPVDEEGKAKLEQFTALLSPKTALVTTAYVNSEIGTVQEVKRLARTIREYNKKEALKILFHLDAAQAPLWLPCQLEQLGVDLLSLDAGKCNGPKGVGVLAMRHGVELKPVLLGGGQEMGLRAGTENTAGIVGAAVAIEEAQRRYEERAEAVSALRNRFIKQLLTIEGVVLNGSAKDRLANNVAISMPGIDTEFAVVVLDTAGIACSTKSACGSGKGAGSHVVRTVSGDETRADSTIRFSLGATTNKRELDRTYRVLCEHVERTREFNQSLSQ